MPSPSRTPRKAKAPLTVFPEPRARKKRRTPEQIAEERKAKAIEDARQRLLASRKRVTAQLPRKLAGLRGRYRYKILHGGRGGSKSWNVARTLVLLAYESTIRVLCAREFQNSITESVHKLLSDQIDMLGLTAYFDVTQTSIKCTLTGSEFIFSGIRNNVTKIKSMEGIDICWVEEAEKVSKESWGVLIPTIRKPGSEIWITFNPNQEDDPTYVQFVVNAPAEEGQYLRVEINYRDNPWFPLELRREMEYMRRVDFDAYLHVWEGKCRNVSDAQVLKGKISVQDFVPEAEGTGEWHGPYFGADWGFAQDPTTLVKCWINERTLYIEHEAYAVGKDIDATPAMFDEVPGAREHNVLADSARPETISYMQRHGYHRLAGVLKWPGSVEDGVMFLRSFERIVLHSRCKHAAIEARLWSYKTDRLTGKVMPVLLDAHNHIWDAVRYALQPLIRQANSMGLMDYVRNLGKPQQSAVPALGTTVVAEQPSVGTEPHEISQPWTKAVLARNNATRN